MTLQQRRWVSGSDGRIYHYEYFSPAASGGTLHGLTVYDVSAKDWQLADQLHTRSATWTGVAYELQEGWRK